MIVVDANVAVKWFVREPGWESAERVAAYPSLSAPSHLVVVSAAVTKTAISLQPIRG